MFAEVGEALFEVFQLVHRVVDVSLLVGAQEVLEVVEEVLAGLGD